MPKVSIGMPVYNGENYIREAIESIIIQTYQDFELIICDNASVDNTRDICLYYKRKDKRISYICNERNLGASKNFNKTFQISQGEYFKWATHDDKISANMLESCVRLLDKDKSVILAYPRTISIDPHGKEIQTRNEHFVVTSASPAWRYTQLCLYMYKCYPVFGLMRSQYLRQTRLIDSFPHSDRILLLELSLLGRFSEVSEAIFYRRFHHQNSLLENVSPLERMLWFNADYTGKPPHEYLRVFVEKFRSVHRATVSPHHKLLCYGCIFLWALKLSASELAIRLGLKKSWVEREKSQVTPM